MKSELALLANESSFKLDYAELIDEDTFEIADQNSLKVRAIIAGWVDGVRLIDNMAMKRTLVRT